MRQPARPDLWEPRVGQPPGATRQVRAAHDRRGLCSLSLVFAGLTSSGATGPAWQGAA